MYHYHFYGVVHPERFPITLRDSLQIPAVPAEIVLSIISSEAYVRCSSNVIQNDMDTLQNNVRIVVQDLLSMVGFIKGLGYEIEIRRVINEEQGIDYVFGHNIPVLEERGATKDLIKEMGRLRSIITKCHDHGVYVRMCLRDLNHAIRLPEDTGFHCFRAIEALRNYCGSVFDVVEEKEQWAKLAEITRFGKDKTDYIRGFALPNRHGQQQGMSDRDRIQLFKDTWDIVEGFLMEEEKRLG